MGPCIELLEVGWGVWFSVIPDAHRQRIINWINATGGTSSAFDVTTKVRLIPQEQTRCTRPASPAASQGILHSATQHCYTIRCTQHCWTMPSTQHYSTILCSQHSSLPL